MRDRPSSEVTRTLPPQFGTPRRPARTADLPLMAEHAVTEVDSRRVHAAAAAALFRDLGEEQPGGLLLPLLARGGPLNPRRLTRSVRTGGYDGSRVEKRKRAAAANVAAVQENDRIVSPDTPRRQENDL
jgi:hypothetical protein